MKERYDNMDALIAKHLAGETDTAEATDLQEWLAENADNQQYFEQLQRIWDLAPAAHLLSPEVFDTEMALQKVKTKMAFREKALPTRMPRYWMQAGIAAAIAILAVAIWFLRPSGANYPTAIAANAAAILTDTLSDGSVVTLNRNSGLAIAKGFNKKERRMTLHGEAYFEVAPDKERPFVVEVNDLEVKVVGTAFNIDNASTPGKVLIAVTHGKVLVSNGGQSMFLTADETAEYDQQTHVITRLQNQQNPNTLAYKNKVFLFNATPLQEVVRQLNTSYGANISLQNKNLATCQLTARYNNLAIGRVLELIADSFSIKVEKNPDGTYVLTGVGCGE